jgi:hypothetical protein
VNAELVERKRYATPKRFLSSEARRMMTSHEDRLIRYLIEAYKDRADEGDIILSAKRAATIIGTSHPTAMKALRGLVDKQVIKATYEGNIERPNKCSRWRLLMFPYKSEPAEHEYLTPRERRGIRRNVKLGEFTIRGTADAFERIGIKLGDISENPAAAF